MMIDKLTVQDGVLGTAGETLDDPTPFNIYAALQMLSVRLDMKGRTLPSEMQEMMDQAFTELTPEERGKIEVNEICIAEGHYLLQEAREKLTDLIGDLLESLCRIHGNAYSVEPELLRFSSRQFPDTMPGQVACPEPRSSEAYEVLRDTYHGASKALAKIDPEYRKVKNNNVITFSQTRDAFLKLMEDRLKA